MLAGWASSAPATPLGTAAKRPLSSASSSRHPACASCRAWPRASTRRRTSVPCARLTPGRSPSSATGSIGRIRRATRELWRYRGRARAARQRVADRRRPGGLSLPAPQPDHRRLLRGGRRRREPRNRRQPDHRRRGGRARRAGDGRAGFAPQPGGQRNQPAHRRRRRAGHRRRRRAGRARARHSTLAVPRSSIPVLRRAGFEAQVLDRCRRDPATLDELVVELQQPIGEVAMARRPSRTDRLGARRDADGSRWSETWPDLV